jgi:hypothetical protein
VEEPLDTEVQPSSVDVVVVSVGVDAAAGGGVTCESAAPGSDGIVGIVPIESS